MDIRNFFNDGAVAKKTDCNNKITELENLISIEKLKIVNIGFAEKIHTTLDELKTTYGEKLFAEVINSYMDYEIMEEEEEEALGEALGDPDEWNKHRPTPGKKYKHGQKGVACKMAVVANKSVERWSFTGYSYIYRKKICKQVSSKAQACAYAKKVWDGYP